MEVQLGPPGLQAQSMWLAPPLELAHLAYPVAVALRLPLLVVAAVRLGVPRLRLPQLSVVARRLVRPRLVLHLLAVVVVVVRVPRLRPVLVAVAMGLRAQRLTVRHQ